MVLQEWEVMLEAPLPQPPAAAQGAVTLSWRGDSKFVAVNVLPALSDGGGMPNTAFDIS